MNHLVYKVTNLLDGTQYIGVHSTDNVNDGYLGSGSAVKRAIKKFGKENFSKEVLFNYDNSESMLAKERELVTESFIRNEKTYNLMPGGKGWSKLTNEHRAKISETKKKHWSRIKAKAYSKNIVHSMRCGIKMPKGSPRCMCGYQFNWSV